VRAERRPKPIKLEAEAGAGVGDRGFPHELSASAAPDGVGQAAIHPFLRGNDDVKTGSIRLD
jgi:hypothetical protein